jgi:hypothetical protein
MKYEGEIRKALESLLRLYENEETRDDPLICDLCSVTYKIYKKLNCINCPWKIETGMLCIEACCGLYDLSYNIKKYGKDWRDQLYFYLTRDGESKASSESKVREYDKIRIERITQLKDWLSKE